MIEIFSKKHIDIWIAALSLVPIFVFVFFCGTNPVLPILNWVVSAILAWMIRDIIERHHLGYIDRNHAFPISLTLIFSITNFSLLNYGATGSNVIAILQMFGFLGILFICMISWQQKIAPLHYIFSGIIIGVISIFFRHSLYWILLFPFIFYHMRSWSKQNLGSLVSGLLLSVWVVYVLLFFLVGEESADSFILSYNIVLDDFSFVWQQFTICEWAMIASTVLLIVIYSIFGYTLNVVNNVKAESSIIMLSSLSLILSLLGLFDTSHLINYICVLSIPLSMLISVHQSCIVNAKNDWWTIFILLFFSTLNVLPLFPLSF